MSTYTAPKFTFSNSYKMIDILLFYPCNTFWRRGPTFPSSIWHNQQRGVCNLSFERRHQIGRWHGGSNSTWWQVDDIGGAGVFRTPKKDDVIFAQPLMGILYDFREDVKNIPRGCEKMGGRLHFLKFLGGWRQVTHKYANWRRGRDGWPKNGGGVV